jgi:hypothetical protein
LDSEEGELGEEIVRTRRCDLRAVGVDGMELQTTRWLTGQLSERFGVERLHSVHLLSAVFGSVFTDFDGSELVQALGDGDGLNGGECRELAWRYASEADSGMQGLRNLSDG